MTVLAVVSNVLSHVCYVYMSSLSFGQYIVQTSEASDEPENRYGHKTNDRRVFCFN